MYFLGLAKLGLITVLLILFTISVLYYNNKQLSLIYFKNATQPTGIVLGEINSKLSNEIRQMINTTFANYSSRKCNFLTFWWSGTGRIGNQMFIYASFYSMAKANNKIPFVKYKYFPLRSGFRISVPYFNNSLLNESTFDTHVPDPGAFGFTDKVFNLSCDKNYEQGGFRASWKHFEKFTDEIRKEFQFVDYVQRECDRFYNILESNNIYKSNCLLIGAHMRRGDFTTDKSRNYGFEPARADYLQNAIKFFEKRYSNESCVTFIVLGDDYKWNVQNSPNQSNIIIPKPHWWGYVDMCILSKCNHTIISAGTFGWWVAFLTGGDATYQKHQCRPNSYHCSSMRYPNYIDSKWNWFPL